MGIFNRMHNQYRHQINMFVKLAVIACSVAVAIARYTGPLAGGVPAHQYPAGVSPAACPNFPHCANPAVAANPSAPEAYNAYHAAPVAYNNHAYNPNAYNHAPATYHHGSVQEALNRGEYIGDGDYKGEGLAESGAFGPVDYPNHAASYAHAGYAHPGQAHAGYAHPGQAHAGYAHGHSAQLPAGVNPASCPNYPYCH